MKRLGLICVKFSHKSHKSPSFKGIIRIIAKNRIHRHFPLHVYQNMTTDVTEFKTQEGKKSELSPIMNMAIGESLPFLIHLRPDLDFVLESLKGVLPILKQVKYRTTIHSDQG